jgi:hypothetical protein
MPQYNCRFCNKSINKTTDFYSHLYTHVKSNKNEFEQEEIELAEFYYKKRKHYKKKSYYKMAELRKNCILEYKHSCKICDFKSNNLIGIKVHLVGLHSKEELLESGYEKEHVDKLIEEKYKRKEYQKNYQKNYQKKYKNNRVNEDIEDVEDMEDTEDTEDMEDAEYVEDNINNIDTIDIVPNQTVIIGPIALPKPIPIPTIIPVPPLIPMAYIINLLNYMTN